jgi:hypothetical protein
MLKWLQTEQWCVFDEGTCTGAAQGGQLAALQYLRSIDCSWEVQYVALYAAASGSIEMVKWLQQQQGIAIHADVLANAAAAGLINMCQYLHRTGCELTGTACDRAAASGEMGTLRWLRDNGCSWDVYEVSMAAARNGHTDVLDFIIEQGEVLDAEMLVSTLNYAGVYDQLQAAQCLRQHGAEWPTILGYIMYPFVEHWSDDVIAWARAEGCASPTVVPDDVDDDDI